MFVCVSVCVFVCMCVCVLLLFLTYALRWLNRMTGRGDIALEQTLTQKLKI